MNKNITAEDIKSLIGNLDLLVGSRFHTIVFALSQSIPSMALSWSHKYRELLQDFELNEFVFEHDQLKSDLIIDTLARAWKKREKNKNTIKKELPCILRKVDTMFNQVANLINHSKQ